MGEGRYPERTAPLSPERPEGASRGRRLTTARQRDAALRWVRHEREVRRLIRLDALTLWGALPLVLLTLGAFGRLVIQGGFYLGAYPHPLALAGVGLASGAGAYALLRANGNVARRLDQMEGGPRPGAHPDGVAPGADLREGLPAGRQSEIAGLS